MTLLMFCAPVNCIYHTMHAFIWIMFVSVNYLEMLDYAYFMFVLKLCGYTLILSDSSSMYR